MLYISYYYLCFLLKKIRDKGRTGSAWKQGGLGRRGWGLRAKGRNDPNNARTRE
jgi:hypothetical protein